MRGKKRGWWKSGMKDTYSADDLVEVRRTDYTWID